MSLWSGVPNGAGSYNQNSTDSGAGDSNNYTHVDDPLGSPNTTDYLRNQTATQYNDTYAFPNDSSYNGATINSVTVCAMLRRENTSRGVVRSFISRLGATDAYTSSGTVTETTYTQYSGVFTTKPGGGSWTSSDVDSAEFGVRIGGHTLTEHRCTAVWVVVDYSAVTGPSVPTLKLPTNNYITWTVRPPLTIDNSTGTSPVSYHFQISTVTEFDPITVEQSGVASGAGGVTTWTGNADLTPSTQYYWRARASGGGSLSDWSLVSGFQVGIFPAPTGLQCDFSSEIVTTGNGYLNFSAVFLGSGAGGQASGVQVILVSGGAASSYPSYNYDTGWVTISGVASGVRSEIVIYSGNPSSYVYNGISGWYWAIRFKNGSGVYSQWGGARSTYFTGSQYPWQMWQSGISFGNEANNDPPYGPGAVYSGNDAVGKVPWDNVVGITAHLEIWAPFNDYYGNFEIQYVPGTQVTLQENTGYTTYTSSQYPSFFNQSGVWHQVVVTGLPLNDLVSTSGLTYIIHFYDADSVNGDRYDILARVVRVDFTLSGHHAVRMDRRLWYDQRYGERRKVNFGNGHLLLPSGATVELEIDTGAAKVIATNTNEEAMPDAFANVVYGFGKTHAFYLSQNDPADNGLGIYVVTRGIDDVWNTPYHIDQAYTVNDSHHGPAACVDKNGYLHCFYGTHGNWTSEQLKYKRTVNPHETGSGDSGTWTTVSSIASKVTYPIPVVMPNNTIYVLFRTQPAGDSSQGVESLLGYIYSSDSGNTWNGPYYFASNWPNVDGAPLETAEGRTYMHGYAFDPGIGRFHAAISFIDASNRSAGVWYAYTDDFTTWKTISGTTAGVATTEWSGNTLMRPSGTYVPSLVQASNAKQSIFSRPIVVDSNDRPHVFMTADQTRAPFWTWENLDTEGQVIYFPGTVYHSVWDGAQWVTTDISAQIDLGPWASNYSIKPVLKDDDSIDLYINYKPLYERTVLPSMSGSHSQFSLYPSNYSGYDCVNYSRDIYRDDRYIYASGSSSDGYVHTFSGNVIVPSGATIGCVSVELIGDGGLLNDYACPVIVLSGVVYSGMTNSMYRKNAAAIPQNPWVMITRFQYNPGNGLPWAASEVSGVSFGVSKVYGSGQVTVYDVALRLEMIEARTQHHYAGEVIRLNTVDSGSTWTREDVTGFSQHGIPQLSVKNDFSNNRVDLIWSVGNDLIYYDADRRARFRPDGTDVIVVYDGVEIDRVANYWNNDSTIVKFALQAPVVSGFPYGEKDYYLYNRFPEASYPKDDPRNVYKYYESFEDYNSLRPFPTLRRDYREIVDRSLLYREGTADKQYTSSDAKDEVTFPTNGLIANIRVMCTGVHDTSNYVGFKFYLATGSTYDSSNVVYSGTSFSFGSDAVYRNSNLDVYGFDALVPTISGGTSVLFVWSEAPPLGSGTAINYNASVEFIDYFTTVSGWDRVSGYADIIEAPPFAPASVVAGGKALRIRHDDTVVQKTFSQVYDNVDVEFRVLHFSYDNAVVNSVVQLCDSSGNRFSLGLQHPGDGSKYLHPVYFSGATAYTGIATTVGVQSWHNGRIVVSGGLCDAWFNGQKVCTGVNALPNGFGYLRIIGNGYDRFDFITIKDLVSVVPSLMADDIACAHFEAVIQGRRQMAVNVGYLISGWFAQAAAKVNYITNNQVTSNAKVSLSHLETIGGNGIGYFDTCATVLADGGVGLEVTRFLESISSVPFEYLSSAGCDMQAQYEYIGWAIRELGLSYETLATVGADGSVQVEFVAVLRAVAKLFYEALASVGRDGAILYTASNEVVAFAKVLYSYLITLGASNQVNVDWPQVLGRDFQVLEEWAGTVERAGQLAAEYSGLVAMYRKISLSFLSLVHGHGQFSFEFPGGVEACGEVGTENLVTVKQVDGVCYYEHGVSCDRFVQVPVDYSTTIEAGAKLPVEWFGTVSILGLGQVPFDFVGTVERMGEVGDELLHTVGADVSMCYEFCGSVSCSLQIGSENTSTIGATAKVPVSFLVTVGVDGQVSLGNAVDAVRDAIIGSEILSSVIADGKIGFDYTGTLLVLVFGQMPLDVLSTIGSNGKIASESSASIESSAKVVTEALLQVAAYCKAWYEVASQVVSVGASGRLPISWLSTIAPMGQVNWEQVAQVQAGKKCLVEYGVYVSSEGSLSLSQQQFVLSLAKIVDDWCGNINAMGKVRIENIGWVSATAQVVLEFDTGVVVSSRRLPLDYLVSVVSSVNVQFDVVGALVLGLLFDPFTMTFPALSPFAIVSYGLYDKSMVTAIAEGSAMVSEHLSSKNIARYTFSGNNVIGQS